MTDVPVGTYTLRLRIGVPRQPGDAPGNELEGDVEGIKEVGEVLTHLVVADCTTVDVGDVAMGPVRKVEVGQEAPGFEALTLDGKAMQLGDYRGHWVLVDCWATWCGPCLEETPNVRAAAEAYRNEGLIVLGVDYDEDADKARAYVAKEELSGPAWVHALASGWGLGELECYALGLPQIYLIDPEGKVMAKGLRGPGMVEKIGTAMRRAK